ncbi:hypothetical protein M4951_03015 [Blastopirellula sp. J2-11]|uniref:hypothetical protein n=1 Tax=Blastopirellula sp. J2-11 TaxID=2943192 RepID=UPI0021C9D951|nr:hypothetical protein [Blastopirellula sp. J2-11]UUO07288.1 hypothetical protein M4951_03015 [Blastopirellula sp. J2-11]
MARRNSIAAPKSSDLSSSLLKAFADRFALVAESGEENSGLARVRFPMEALRTLSLELVGLIVNNCQPVMSISSDAKEKTAAGQLMKKQQADQHLANAAGE